jgi:hypothetical protein
VRNGYVTREKASEVFHVAIDEVDDDFAVNEPETRALRARI